jgi:mannose-6-phosphate isomerase
MVMTEPTTVYPAREVIKPWGSELVFAEVDDAYVGKVIRVRAGESLSLQYHHEKTETLCVIEGRASIDYGPDQQSLQNLELGVGEAVHFAAGTLHRITAVEDLLLTEVSLAKPGWRTDVVRLEDRYGRTGTSAP